MWTSFWAFPVSEPNLVTHIFSSFSSSLLLCPLLVHVSILCSTFFFVHPEFPLVQIASRWLAGTDEVENGCTSSVILAWSSRPAAFYHRAVHRAIRRQALCQVHCATHLVSAGHRAGDVRTEPPLDIDFSTWIRQAWCCGVRRAAAFFSHYSQNGSPHVGCFEKAGY